MKEEDNATGHAYQVRWIREMRARDNLQLAPLFTAAADADYQEIVGKIAIKKITTK